ncbi:MULTISPECIES: glycosyltransferase [Bacillus]|uniref:glycosyltransferase n=1 Tax=Bacillus TaxID=1386 RepID=UPI00031C9175|nr:MULTISPECIES: glycosyltransferase [Bacillus]
MQNKKVSIIIPVYNNEKFLDKCLNSVINQTLNDIEIIIINDGSTDNSLNKLKWYESKYSNIKLLNQPNSGQAVAINRALDLACGEYVAFVDADDYIENNMIETLYKEAKSSNLDLVICNYTKVDMDGRILSYNDHSTFDNKLLDRNDLIREFLLNENNLVEGFSWNKLIKMKLFNEFNIRYPHIKYEDIPTIFKILTKIKSCKYINDNLYYYVQHNDSITNTKSIQNVKGYIEAIEMVNDILKEENLISVYKEDYFIYRSHSLLSEYMVSIEVVKDSKELTKTFKEIFQSIKINKLLRLNKQVSIKFFIKAVLCKLWLFPQFVMTYHKVKSIFH